MLDNTGKLVRASNFAGRRGSNIYSISNLNSLAAGIYMLQVRAGDKMITEKIIK